MKKLSKNSRFYFPFTEGSTRQLFKNIFLPALKNGFSTFYIGHDFSGGRAVSMFIIENFKYLVKRWDIPVNLDEYRFIFVDPDDLVKSSKKEYLRLITRNLGDSKNSEIQSYTELLGCVRRRLKEAAKEKNVVLVLRGFNYLDFGDMYFWANFASMVSGVDNLGIIFIAYGDGFDLAGKRFARISNMFMQNVEKLDKLSKADIEYSIKRWGYIFDKDFSDVEVSAIKKVSRGRPSLLKACCNILASHDGDHPVEKLESSRIVQRYLQTDKLDFRAGGIYFKGRNITPMFSPQEYDLIKLLFENKGCVVDKDDMADVMWGRQAVQKYSESAITQGIKRIRDKLAVLGIPRSSITTIPTKGYMYRN